MKRYLLSDGQEKRIIRLGIVAFWWLFWLFNVIDKFIDKEVFLFAGKDRLSQFITYFQSIGIENTTFAAATLIFFTILQIIAFVFLTYALIQILGGHKRRAHHGLFWGILTSLIIFSLFAVGDQIFGDRFELLEHSIYWISLIMSWFVYTWAENNT